MSGLHPPILLVLLFVIWVIAPFAVLVLANLISRDWPKLTSSTLYALTLILAISSLVIYSYVLVFPLGAQPAFPYVATPIGTLLLITITMAIAAFISRKQRLRS